MEDLDPTQIRGLAKPNAKSPASRGSVILHLLGGDVSLGDRAGGTGAPAVAGYPVQAWFAGEGTSFDFASMGGP